MAPTDPDFARSRYWVKAINDAKVDVRERGGGSGGGSSFGGSEEGGLGGMPEAEGRESGEGGIGGEEEMFTHPAPQRRVRVFSAGGSTEIDPDGLEEPDKRLDDLPFKKLGTVNEFDEDDEESYEVKHQDRYRESLGSIRDERNGLVYVRSGTSEERSLGARTAMKGKRDIVLLRSTGRRKAHAIHDGATATLTHCPNSFAREGSMMRERARLSQTAGSPP